MRCMVRNAELINAKSEVSFEVSSIFCVVNSANQLSCRRGETRRVFSAMENDGSQVRENVRNQRFAIAIWDSEILLTTSWRQSNVRAAFVFPPRDSSFLSAYIHTYAAFDFFIVYQLAFMQLRAVGNYLTLESINPSRHVSGWGTRLFSVGEFRKWNQR